jgi:energy-coupling factor transporter ATP-binding protein EcfA2
VLALQPEVLILDESTSGLDPRGRKELLERLLLMRREQALTLLIVSPRMEEIASVTERLYVMDSGRITLSGTTREVFGRRDELRQYGLDVPQVTQVAHELEKRGIEVERLPLTVAEGVNEVWRILNS